MDYGICDLSAVPVRAEPSDKSEMTNQLLFGELLRIIKQDKNWTKIQGLLDGYEGWIDTKQYLPLKPKKADKLLQLQPSVALELVRSAVGASRHIPIVIGSNLYDFDGMNFKLGKEKFVYHGQAINTLSVTDPERLVEKCALKYLESPYLWGGRSPFGIDCSGFVQVVFKLLGIKLKRDAWQQMESGKAVDFVDTARQGDLAFFANKEGSITHVGIVLNGGRIIHAHGKVRIDKLDAYGIFNSHSQQYSHKLKAIKRIL